MATSWTTSSWSPDDLLAEPTRVRAPRTIADDDYDYDVSPWRIASRVRTGETLRAICRKYSIPGGFTPVLAGDRSPHAPPPPGSVCVFVDALEAGMRLPLHPFFGAVLDHFEIAPGQLAPNSWRVMAGFVVLSHFAGVAPSLAVFRHFFALSAFGHNKLYSFRSKVAVGSLFGRLNAKNAGWKEEFFFLSSSAPWPCPVQWGVPSRSATLVPALTGEEKGVAAKLLRVRGGSPIDLSTYLQHSNMAAAEIIRAPSPPPPITPQGGLLNTPPARFTAVEEKVKSETDCDVSPRAPWFGKNKRKLPERRANGESSASEYLSYQPGFSPHLRKARTAIPTTSKHGKAATPERHDDGETGGWKAARQLLQGIVTPARQRKHAASRPADVVASSYVSLLQTANEVAFSLDYALELEGRLRDADAELRKVRAELAEAKAAVVQESLGSRSSRRR